MTVALDATYGVDRAPSGVGRYSRELLAGLPQSHPETRFLFYFRPHRFLRSFESQLPANASRRLLAEPIGPRFASIFHGLNQRLPKMRMRRSVATFHDLFVMTGEYSTTEFRARFALQARDAAARADVIIAVSEFTKRQVVSLLGVEESRVRVIYHGVRAPQGPERERERIVLNVGAIQKRKNIVRLIEAFEALDASWRLALAGSFGYGAEDISARIEESPARERIGILGYISPEDLAGLYGRASIFAFPSLDEGFGMPVLEAMASGLPVLTSNRSALPEVAGDAAELVNPEDAAELTEKLRVLAENEDLRCELAARGLARAQLFSWESAVRQTWDVYRELVR